MQLFPQYFLSGNCNLYSSSINVKSLLNSKIKSRIFKIKAFQLTLTIFVQLIYVTSGDTFL